MNHESPCISINHKLSHFENTLVLSKTKEEKNAPYATTKKKYTLVCISQQITNYLRYLPSKKKKKIVRRTQRLAYTQIAHTTNRKKLSLQLLQGSRIIILLKQEKKKKNEMKRKSCRALWTQNATSQEINNSYVANNGFGIVYRRISLSTGCNGDTTRFLLELFPVNTITLIVVQC